MTMLLSRTPGNSAVPYQGERRLIRRITLDGVPLEPAH
jgi:hypothetical protein